MSAPLASAETQCPTETWDPATKTLTSDFSASSPAEQLYPRYSAALWISYSRIGCTYHPRPKNVVITSSKAIDVDLSNVAHELNHPGADPIQLTIDLRPAKYAPNLDIKLGEYKAPLDRVVRLTDDGIDLNGDSVTDVVILSPRIKKLSVRTFRGVDDVKLFAADTHVKYDAIRADVGAGDELVIIRAPDSQVGAYGDEGNDTIVLEGKSGFGSGGSGNDILNARKVREGGGFGGDAGNDKLFLGPGNDNVNEDIYGTGNDYYDTGAGNDRIWDYRGDDTIRSGPGNDDVAVSGRGSTGWDTINLGPGNDRGIVSGKNSRAHVNAGPGNDRVVFFGTASLRSTVDCGAGNDKFSAVHYGRDRNCEHHWINGDPGHWS